MSKEMFISVDGGLLQAVDRAHYGPRLILRKLPEELTGTGLNFGWIARDMCGEVWWYPEEPTRLADNWGASHMIGHPGNLSHCHPITETFTDIPWEDSLRRVVN